MKSIREPCFINNLPSPCGPSRPVVGARRSSTTLAPSGKRRRQGRIHTGERRRSWETGDGSPPLPQRVTELGARPPGARHGRDSGKRCGGVAREETTEGAPERARARGPARMALTAAPPGGAPQPGQTALPPPQWPPPTPPWRPGRPRSGQRAGAPEDPQVGVAKSRKCPFLRALPETRRAGTAWSSCLQTEPRVARQPVRARRTRSTLPGARLE